MTLDTLVREMVPADASDATLEPRPRNQAIGSRRPMRYQQQFRLVDIG